MTNPYRLQDGGVLVIDKDGNIVNVAGDASRCIVPDGGRVSVRLFLADSKKDDKKPTFDAAHQRPRAGVMTTNDRARLDASHHAMVERTKNALKNAK